jgi:hypothetical protein
MEPSQNREAILRRRIHLLLLIFIVALLISGATAIPLETELNSIARLLPESSTTPPDLVVWFLRVRDAIADINSRYPFLSYGTDWLAFGHFVIAIAFLGPLRDPVKNKWVLDFGIIACALIIPYALIMGGARWIPIYWRLIDCSFGIFGAIPLLLCRKYVNELELDANSGR